MPSDIIVALSDAEFVSFMAPVGTKVLVGIRNGRSIPLRLPNVALNVVAYELGHAIGLRHNSDPTKLMCGRPAPCRASAFQPDREYSFPITAAEASFLLQLYPETWAALWHTACAHCVHVVSVHSASVYRDCSHREVIFERSLNVEAPIDPGERGLAGPGRSSAVARRRAEGPSLRLRPCHRMAMVAPRWAAAHPTPSNGDARP